MTNRRMLLVAGAALLAGCASGTPDPAKASASDQQHASVRHRHFLSPARGGTSSLTRLSGMEIAPAGGVNLKAVGAAWALSVQS